MASLISIMRYINKNELIDITRKILNNLERPQTHETEKEYIPTKYIYRRGISFQLSGDNLTEYNKLLNLISENEQFKDVSIKTIETEYLDILSNLIEIQQPTDQQIRSTLDEFLNKLPNLIENFYVIMAIDNLKLDGINEIKIGNVCITPYDLIKDNLIKNINSVIDPNPHYNEQEKDELKKHAYERIQKLSNKVCARVGVRAEQNASFIKGAQEIDSVINLLRCFIPLLFSRGSDVTLGLSGEFFRHSRYAISFKCSGGFSDEMKLSKINEYILDTEKLKHLEDKCHLKDLGEILSKNISSRSEIEKRISTAIRWIGTAMEDDYDCDKFFKFSVALECLLTNRSEEITTPLAERCAFILSDDKEKRIDVFKRIKDLYGIRSKIAHEGQIEIENNNLEYIMWASISCLLTICDNMNKYKWYDFDDLVKWVQEKKFE